MQRCNNTTRDIEIGLLRIIRLCGDPLWGSTFAKLDEFARTIVAYPAFTCATAELPRDEKKVAGVLLDLSDDLQKRLIHIVYVAIFMNKLRGYKLERLSEMVDWLCVLNDLDWRLFSDLENNYFKQVAEEKGIQLLLKSLNRHPFHPQS